MKKILNILAWVLTVFMALVAVSYFPSVASILAALFAVICAPVRKLQDFYKSKGLKSAVKSALLVVLFFTAIFATPTLETSPDSSIADGKQEMKQLADQRTEDDTETAVQEPDNAPLEDVYTGEEVDAEQIPADKDPEPSSPAEQEEPQQEASAPVSATEGQTTEAVSKPASEPETGIEQEQKPSDSQSGGNNNFNTYDNEEQQNTRDYVLNSGTMKFHYPSCRSVKKIAPENYSTYSGTRDEIIAKGYSPCGNCHP